MIVNLLFAIGFTRWSVIAIDYSFYFGYCFVNIPASFNFFIAVRYLLSDEAVWVKGVFINFPMSSDLRTPGCFCFCIRNPSASCHCFGAKGASENVIGRSERWVIPHYFFHDVFEVCAWHGALLDQLELMFDLWRSSTVKSKCFEEVQDKSVVVGG